MFSTFHLPRARFAEVSLETLAQEDEARFGTPVRSRLLDPVYCQRLLDTEHARRGITHSYGDYFTSRRATWRGGYQEHDQRFIHLGLDIAVPEGTPVTTPFAASVEILDIDQDQDGGWGGRVFLKSSLYRHMPVLLLAHLAGDFLVQRGDIIPEGTALGFIADSIVNGGWFPHLHAQAIARQDWPCVKDNLQHLDGYCTQAHAEKLATIFPNPLPYLLRKQKS